MLYYDQGTNMDNATIAIGVSIFALIISGITLWYSHLRPFKVNVSFDAPTLSLYTITPDISGDERGHTWWIPSFDIGMTVSNLGACHGYVHDIRIVANMNSYRTEKKIYFYPKWIVDSSLFNQYHTERFQWVKKAIIRDWYPYRLSGNKEIEFHIVLEGDRFDHKEAGNIVFELQIATSEKPGWQKLEDFDLYITEDDFDEKSTHSALNKKIEELRKII
jgi:hypothetical protein